MRALSIDIETYSSNDLVKGGVYKYVEAPDFEILMIGIGVFGDTRRFIYTHGIDDLPETFLKDLTDPDVIKTAYNAQFERVCLSKFFGLVLPPEQWECTMVKAAYFGYPFGLGAVAAAMGLDAQKDTAGKALIRYFSMPCKPTKTNGGRTRNLPEHDPEKWIQFKNYCTQDVKVEMLIRDHLTGDLPMKEKQLYWLDQRINDRGMKIDKELVDAAIAISKQHTDDLMNEATAITKLDNPNSAAQLKAWLSDALDQEITSLTKSDLPTLSEAASDDDTKRVIEIRKELAKTSVKKYTAMTNAVCADGRVRGLLQFYGANRTGRWAGRLVQIQNLPQNHLHNLKTAREVIRTGDMELIKLFFDDIPDTLSQLIRTAFIGDYKIIDFSAIEARVIAWLAGEKWRLKVFETHGKIYEASASAMFGIPIEEITKESDLRQKGKVSELALGYQGGPGALIAMGALGMGLTEDELPGIVNAWRRSNPRIVRLWRDVQDAALEAIQSPGAKVKVNGKVSFSMKEGDLIVTLPSGRGLYYLKAYVTQGQYGPAIKYKGINQVNRKWQNIETYGGKLVENIVQAIARDCLAEAMLKLDKAGYPICGHVHDEAIVDDEADCLKKIEAIMSEPILWAPGLLLKVSGFESNFYKK